MDISNRADFAAAIRYARATRTISSYGRLGSFGRSLILSDGARFVYTAWTARPPMNIHPTR